jgi:hypothetical protein
MTTKPINASPAGGVTSTAQLIQIDTALKSMRDSGFDLTAAAGEPIDNAIEAGASIIRVLTKFDESRGRIEEMAFADNGRGIDSKVLAPVLSMGYSTRYDQRRSLGRFGVGLKLAGLSLGTRIEVYTKTHNDTAIYCSHIDLTQIGAGEQLQIEATPARPISDWPQEYMHAMRNAQDGPFQSGTLVVFGQIDRLTSGGTYGTGLHEKISELRNFIARAYRRFLDQGLVIELDAKPISLFDPLFLLDNPRIIKRYGPEEVRGTVVDEADIEIADGHSIHVTVTLAPEEFRPKEGAGGGKDSKGRDIGDFRIDDSAGKISMLRNDREINYDIVPRLLPAGVDKVDRYIGIEVAFPAELDEYFQVRNVKRGAVPVNKLREELRRWLDRPVRAARKQIRGYWNEVKTRERATSEDHTEATEAAARAEKTAPGGKAGQDLSPEDVDQAIRDLLKDLGLDSGEDTDEQEARIREQIERKPIVLVDGDWPGKELFEIVHLNGKAIVKVNHRHPFIRDVYDPLKKVATDGVDQIEPEELIDLARKVELAIDVLFLAYAKAENMHPNPDTQYDSLRSYWGQFTHSYLREALKGE